MLCLKGIFLSLGQAFFCVGKDEFFPAYAKMKVGACLFLMKTGNILRIMSRVWLLFYKTLLLERIHKTNAQGLTIFFV